jgi:hypothetical protein
MDHSVILDRFSCSLYSSSKLLICRCNVESSAHIIRRDVTQAGKSQTNKLKSNGPKTDPWMTSDGTWKTSEKIPPRNTRCFLFLNHSYRLPSIPALCNFKRSRLWGMLSNAFSQSNEMTCMCPPECVSISLCQSLIACMCNVLQDRLGITHAD